jgi:hypothetical protein
LFKLNKKNVTFFLYKNINDSKINAKHLFTRLYKIGSEVDNGLSNDYLGKQLARNADLGNGILI